MRAKKNWQKEGYAAISCWFW